MPIIQSAKKALRHDRRRTKFNSSVKRKALTAIKKARLNPNPKTIKLAYSALDKAGKKHIFKKGKVNRLKSRLAKSQTSPTPKVRTRKNNSGEKKL